VNYATVVNDILRLDEKRCSHTVSYVVLAPVMTFASYNYIKPKTTSCQKMSIKFVLYVKCTNLKSIR
jgi:hypothetical protein